MFTNKQVHMQTDETVNIPFPPSEHDQAVAEVICRQQTRAENIRLQFSPLSFMRTRPIIQSGSRP
jgi:hypothetical protein